MEEKNYKWISNKLQGMQIKTRIFLYVIILFLPTIIKGQEFSFNLFFEDAAGNKDTIVLGYDEAATNSIDEVFGEEDIKDVPFDNIFEARVSNEHWFYYPISFLSKKQIQKNNCLSENFPYVNFIHLKCKYFPVTVRWDKKLFTDECRFQSLITDWYPGGWFDAVYGTEQGPFYLKDMDSAVFTHTTKEYLFNLYERKDTLKVLFMTIASVKNVIVGLQESKILNYQITFNNPAFYLLKVKSKEGNIISVMLYDIFGRNILNTNESDAIDVSNLGIGMYIIKINFGDFSVSDKLLIVK